MLWTCYQVGTNPATPKKHTLQPLQTVARAFGAPLFVALRWHWAIGRFAISDKIRKRIAASVDAGLCCSEAVVLPTFFFGER